MYNDEVWMMIREMKEKGMSITAIAEQLGIDRKTVRKYMNSDKVPRPSHSKRKSKLDPVKPIIKVLIDKYDLSAVRILEEIRKWGYNGSYTILKEYCRTLRRERSIKAVYRFETDPGKQAQVDFGSFGTLEEDGVSRKLYCFSYVLGYSRMRYAEFTTNISVQNLIRMHLNAFIHTGGIPSEILYDNMKQVVIERKIGANESKFNSLFLQFSEHYGFDVRLCYPHRPQTKGKVENSIKFIRNNFFAGREFSSLQDMNNQLSLWLENVNSRTHGSTGKIPMDLVREENLHPLDSIPEFRFRITEERKVSSDCYVSYKGNRYSVPWKYAGRIATVSEEGSILKIVIGEDTYEHEILQGTGRISRKEEHFEGLLAALKDRNLHNYRMEVEKRDLRKYEVI